MIFVLGHLTRRMATMPKYGKTNNVKITSLSWIWPMLTLLRRSGERFRASSYHSFLQHVPIIQQDGSSSEQSSSSNRGLNERTTNTGRGIMSRMSLRRGEKSKHRNSCANDQQGTIQKTLCKMTTLTKTKNCFLRSSFCLFLSGRLNRVYCIFSFWWIIPYHIDTVSIELTILYNKGLRSKISIQRCILFLSL